MKNLWFKRLILPFSFLLSIAGLAIGNDYYTHGGFPATGSVASSASMRAELDTITAGFDKLPSFAGNASKAVIVNGGATALSVTTGTLSLGGNFSIAGAFSTTGAFGTTLVQGATTTLTLPVVNGTLATLAGTETLTTKTINLSSNTLTGTRAQFNTALSDDNFVTLAGSETLTNKVLTSPQIDNPAFSGDASGGLTNLVMTTPALASPSFSGTVVGTYTLGGTPTISSPVINTPTITGGTMTQVPITQNSQSTAYTTVLTDGGKHLLHPTADNNPRTFTIAANASVAYPIGTVITFVNQINTMTIAINSDTMTLAGTSTTGSRTLAANGMATAMKITTTAWIISGSGLS
jgi:hypothetical protein